MKKLILVVFICFFYLILNNQTYWYDIYLGPLLLAFIWTCILLSVFLFPLTLFKKTDFISSKVLLSLGQIIKIITLIFSFWITHSFWGGWGAIIIFILALLHTPIHLPFPPSSNINDCFYYAFPGVLHELIVFFVPIFLLLFSKNWAPLIFLILYILIEYFLIFYGKNKLFKLNLINEIRSEINVSPEKTRGIKGEKQ